MSLVYVITNCFFLISIFVYSHSTCKKGEFPANMQSDGPIPQVSDD